MANECQYCGSRRPPSSPGYPHGTRMIMLPGDFVEFCEPCGRRETLVNADTGEVKTLHDLSMPGKEPAACGGGYKPPSPLQA